MVCQLHRSLWFPAAAFLSIWCGAASQGDEFSDAVHALNPDAYYRFDVAGASGSDETGSHHFTSVDPGVSFHAEGPRPTGFVGMDAANHAWDFAAGTRAQVLDYVPAAGDEPRSLVGWFNTDVTRAQHGGPIDLFGWNSDINGPNTSKGWMLKVDAGFNSSTGTPLGYDVVSLNIQGRQVQAKTTPVVPNQWHMVGVVYDGGPLGSAKIYVDNVLQELINDTGVVPSDPGPAPIPYGFSIGRALGGFGMDGQIDHVATWNRALRSRDVTDLYEIAVHGIPLSGPSQPGQGGPWTVLPLRGQSEFVFASAVPTEEINAFNAHLDMVASRQFGNGLDVLLGPASYVTQQYQSVADRGLSAVVWHNTSFPGIFSMGNPGFSQEQKSVLQILDKPGAPAPVHFGEWGYTFHNLLGIGSKGYTTVPTSKQQAYQFMKAYFNDRNNTYDGRLFSVTGHSHYEAYAAEWGAQAIGLELGENIRFSQSKMAFARGASRQWDVPWSVQVSAWFHGSLTTTGALTGGPGTARGEDAGHSHSLYKRLWHHSWFAGAGQVTPEGGGFYLYEEGGAAPYTLTSLGQIAQDFYHFTLEHDRGVPYTPIVVVMDRYAGYNGYEDRPWGVLNKTAGDQQLVDLFQHQLFPGSGDSNNPDATNPEAPYLVATPYGESFDVMLSTATGGTLQRYPEILLAGDVSFSAGFVDELEAAVQAGSRLLISQAHASDLGADLARLQEAGRVEILLPWNNPSTGRAAAIANSRLEQLVEEHLPIDVSGDVVQYQINRNAEGWVVELINNSGVTKIPHLPTVIDAGAVAEVTLTPMVDVIAAYDWETGTPFDLNAASIDVSIGPGEIFYVQFVIGLAGDYNQNGSVDAADYTIWRDRFGQSVVPWTGPDGDGNGIVDQNDYYVWKRHFGQAAAAALLGGVSNVPEPSTLVFALPIFLGMLLQFRNHACSKVMRDAR